MRTDSIGKNELKNGSKNSEKNYEGSLSAFKSHLNEETKNDKGSNLVKLGSLEKNQTVSDLLIGNRLFKNNCWKIIHDSVNDKKPFEKIRAGTDIFLNPETNEIVWGSEAVDNEDMKLAANSEVYNKLNKSHEVNHEKISTPQISKAVENYMGKDYKAMDCFELLVHGLKNMGVQYYGKGGLREKLISMASNEGRPKYSYLNGEGIIKASGQEVYNKSFLSISRNYKKQAEKIYNEIKPYLSKDQILSFSTNSSGHTGIISKNNEDWTYINSGKLDNSINNATKIEGVGEEDLKNEFVNWFKRAYSKKEGLTITLGELSQMKLAVFGSQPTSIKA